MTLQPAPRRPVPLGRRAFLGRLAVLGGAGLLGPGFLAACGGGDDTDDTAGGGGGDGGGGSGGGGNVLRFDNWPGYIDEETVALFADESGLDFTYTEAFNDNNEYFARVQADLGAGRDIGADIIAPTNWMAARLIGLEYVKELPLDAIPNAANLVASLQSPSWDPTGTFTLPWQSGMTGIAYNIEETGRELTSMEDLFDPAFSGRIGMLTEMRDTVGLLLLASGIDPADATFDDATGAFDRLQTAKDDGTIRQFTGNDYMDDLASGNFAACIGWSGDISQLALDNPALRFVIPDEGGMQWSDVMAIPVAAPNTAAAATWMNYVYDPENAARITAFVGYNSPVDGVREVLEANPDTAALAESPLLFPDEATLSRLHVFKTLTEDEEAAFDERFAEIIGA
jgi:spermidine/putrescine transport system substrate-binding protein